MATNYVKRNYKTFQWLAYLVRHGRSALSGGLANCWVRSNVISRLRHAVRVFVCIDLRNRNRSVSEIKPSSTIIQNLQRKKLLQDKLRETSLASAKAFYDR